MPERQVCAKLGEGLLALHLLRRFGGFDRPPEIGERGFVLLIVHDHRDTSLAGQSCSREVGRGIPDGAVDLRSHAESVSPARSPDNEWTFRSLPP